VRFMERFVTLLTLKPEHLVDQAYLVFSEDVISSVDSISKTRTADIRGGSAPSQRVTTKQGLVSDAEALVQLQKRASSTKLEADPFPRAYFWTSIFDSSHSNLRSRKKKFI